MQIITSIYVAKKCFSLHKIPHPPHNQNLINFMNLIRSTLIQLLINIRNITIYYCCEPGFDI